MKTILFIDKGEAGIWESFQRNAFLLDEFRRRGLFEVCDWHPAGMSVRTAVPAIHSMLDGVDDWRAVIVTDLRGSHPSLTDDPHFDNPFDFADSYEVDPVAPVEESGHPLVRLTQMLGGLPSKTRTEAHVEDVGGRSTVRYEISQVRGSSFFDIERRYNLSLPRPAMVTCVSPRDVDADLYRARTDELRAQGEEPTFRSGFWERNCYPDSARFVVCDRPVPSLAASTGSEEEELAARMRAYDKAREDRYWTGFWLAILSLLTADLSPDFLKPYRLYALSIDVDQRQLRSQLDDRYTRWTVARRKVDEQLVLERQRRRQPQGEGNVRPGYQVNIDVRFEPGDLTGLRVRPDRLSFVQADDPRDVTEWREQDSALEDHFARLMREPLRGLVRARESFREKRTMSREELGMFVLDSQQQADLDEELGALELRLAATTGHLPFSSEAYKEELDARRATIARGMHARPKRASVVGAIGYVVVGLVLGFLPQLLGVASGHGYVRGSIPLLAAYVVAGLVALLPLLFRQWYGVVAPLRSLNDWLGTVRERLDRERARLGTRLSGYATYLRGCAVREHQRHLEEDLPTERAEELGRENAVLKTRLDSIRSIAGPRHIDRDLALKLSQEPWGAVEPLLDDPEFLGFSPERYARCTFNQGIVTQDLSVRAPFGFVRGISLEMLKVF